MSHVNKRRIPKSIDFYKNAIVQEYGTFNYFKLENKSTIYAILRFEETNSIEYKIPGHSSLLATQRVHSNIDSLQNKFTPDTRYHSESK